MGPEEVLSDDGFSFHSCGNSDMCLQTTVETVLAWNNGFTFASGRVSQYNSGLGNQLDRSLSNYLVECLEKPPGNDDCLNGRTNFVVSQSVYELTRTRAFFLLGNGQFHHKNSE